MKEEKQRGEKGNARIESRSEPSELGVVGRPSAIIHVVLAGGSGTRLWPISRGPCPKQFVGVLGTRLLLQSTIQRMQRFSGHDEIASAPIVVCGIDRSHLTAEHIKASGAQARVIAEPRSRGTAPALTLAACAACSHAPDAIIACAQGKQDREFFRPATEPFAQALCDSIDYAVMEHLDTRIVVQRGARLSLQLHHHRAEHWTVVRATALVDRGDEQFLLGENESTSFRLGVTHRLQNPGKLSLEIIEVQSGPY